MKKTLLKSFSLILAFVMLAAQTHSLSAKTITTNAPDLEESVFVLDQAAMDQAFSELDDLESFLSQNEGVTYADLQAAGSDLIANISDITAPMGQGAASDDPLFGIPAFWWGCVLGWVGLLLVYLLTDKDREQTRKAMTGCLISTGVGVVLSGIYYFWIWNEVY
ncbi:MAG: hypothetical protein K0B05_03905 [Bacteroidales bacterium]|nr:hypothetical protein [Bacteroidales bacterium]